MEHHLLASFGLLRELDASGFRVAFLDDPERIADVIADIGKPYVTDILNPSLNDFSRHTGRWMTLYQDQEPVVAGGFRIEDLGDEDVASFWRKVFRRHYGNGKNTLGRISPILSERLSGRLAYFGDMYVADDFREFNPRMKRAFADLAHIFVHGIWQPDWHYSFVRQRDAARGAMTLYGYTTVCEHPMDWLIDPPLPRSRGEVCVYTSRAEMLERIKRYSEVYPKSPW